MDIIYRLKNKYGADSVEELLKMAEKSREELEHIERADETLEQLNKQKQALYKEAKILAEKLTQTRLTAFERMEQQLVEACTFLNMPGTRFVLQHSRGPLAGSGQDTVEFYISTNLAKRRSLWQKSHPAVSFPASCWR